MPSEHSTKNRTKSTNTLFNPADGESEGLCELEGEAEPLGEALFEADLLALADGDCDLDDFHYFKGIRNLEKAIEQVIKNYGHQLSHIDFKWSEEEEEFDQFTIYSV